jgi:hypothetical protein
MTQKTSSDRDSGKQISDAIAHLFQELTSAGLATMPQEFASAEITNELIANLFQGIASSGLSELPKEATTNAEVNAAIGQFFDGLATIIPSTTAKRSTSKQSVLETLVNFFKADDWEFQKLDGIPVLQLAFQGQHGRWDCYAKAIDEQGQFLFYSVYPTNAPEDKRSLVAEFLTRANLGMIVGNFELNFDNGEIRYKTSIDVEGERLTPVLIKRLVYTNVTMMDKYFPGINSVIESDVLPEDAIAQIESQPE